VFSQEVRTRDCAIPSNKQLDYEKDKDTTFCGGLFVREGVRACDPFLAARLKIFCVEPNNGNKKVKLYG